MLIGPSGSGKSTFARTHFRATEVLSSDYLRGVVRDDESDMAASADAFDLLRYIARKRLAAGLLTVVDATNVKAEDRAPLISLAREYHAGRDCLQSRCRYLHCPQQNAARTRRESALRAGAIQIVAP
ncbi:MAG: AAA family ATPase [Planctomycetota bacterium]